MILIIAALMFISFIAGYLIPRITKKSKTESIKALEAATENGWKAGWDSGWTSATESPINVHAQYQKMFETEPK